MTRHTWLLTLLAACLLIPLGAARAGSIDFDSATIADINAAFKAGTLTSEQLVTCR